MRVLARDNPAAAASILDTLQSLFRLSPFDGKISSAAILSGEDEGVGGWVTANYINGSLSESVATIGALDLGGASTQVTFEVLPFAATTTISLFQQKFNLYTHSHLCYGLISAQQRLNVSFFVCLVLVLVLVLVFYFFLCVFLCS